MRTSPQVFPGRGPVFSVKTSSPGPPRTQARWRSGIGNSLWFVNTPAGAYIVPPRQRRSEDNTRLSARDESGFHPTALATTKSAAPAGRPFLRDAQLFDFLDHLRIGRLGQVIQPLPLSRRPALRRENRLILRLGGEDTDIASKTLHA